MLLTVAALPAVAGAVTTTTKKGTTPTPSTTTPTTPTTTTPAPAITIRWNKSVRVEKSLYGGLDGVSCPATNLCVAVDQAGQIAYSTAPTNRFWHLTAVDTANSLTAISCPTASFCAAVDDAGNLVWSRAPTGGRAKWSKPVRIDSASAPAGGPAGLTAISCPSAKLCVATDGAPTGNVIVSTNPTGGAKAWTAARIGGTNSLGGTLASVYCVATTFCVATGSQHYYTADPAGGASAWHATGGPTAGGVLASVVCPATTICVGVGYGNSSVGLSDVTAKPTGGLTGWITTAITGTPPAVGAGLVDSVGCPSAGFCVAVDGFDDTYTTTTPLTGGWVGGAAIRPKSASQWSSISCLKTFCMVVDSAGVETVGIVHG